MLHLSFVSSSYLIPLRYKAILLCTFLTGSLLSGVLFPMQSFPHAPQVAREVLAAKNTAVIPVRTASIIKKAASQVIQLGIGSSKVLPTPTAAASVATNDWGVAHQIDEHTWTMNIGVDDRMATAQEIFNALNAYRIKNGKQTLAWDDTLATFAATRAQKFASLGTTDKHEGFIDYINNQDGFAKLGFNSLGENSSYGYKLLGVHLIEWVYASDAPHNENQLSSSWSHVGIGVNETSTDLVFGGSKR